MQNYFDFDFLYPFYKYLRSIIIYINTYNPKYLLFLWQLILSSYTVSKNYIKTTYLVLIRFVLFEIYKGKISTKPLLIYTICPPKKDHMFVIDSQHSWESINILKNLKSLNYYKRIKKSPISYGIQFKIFNLCELQKKKFNIMYFFFLF